MGRITGLEPATFGTTNQRSNQLSYIRHTESFQIRGGADRTRTDDPLHAMQVLYQLSYNPTILWTCTQSRLCYAQTDELQPHDTSDLHPISAVQCTDG